MQRTQKAVTASVPPKRTVALNSAPLSSQEASIAPQASYSSAAQSSSTPSSPSVPDVQATPPDIPGSSPPSQAPAIASPQPQPITTDMPATAPSSSSPTSLQSQIKSILGVPEDAQTAPAPIKSNSSSTPTLRQTAAELRALNFKTLADLIENELLDLLEPEEDDWVPTRRPVCSQPSITGERACEPVEAEQVTMPCQSKAVRSVPVGELLDPIQEEEDRWVPWRRSSTAEQLTGETGCEPVGPEHLSGTVSGRNIPTSHFVVAHMA